MAGGMTYKVATDDVHEVIDLMRETVLSEGWAAQEHATWALTAILHMDERPAHEVVQEWLGEFREQQLDAVAQSYLRTRLNGSLDRERLRSIVAFLYPAASPGQDGWSSFLSDHPEASKVYERGQR
jgi:hypothetical protein